MKIIFVAISVLVLSSCTLVTHPSIYFKNNVVAKGYNKSVSKLYVISSLSTTQEYSYFDKKLKASMLKEAKDIEVIYTSITGVELDRNIYLKQAIEKKATHILVIKPNGGVVDQYGNVSDAKYELNLLDAQNMSRIWKTDIMISLFGNSDIQPLWEDDVSWEQKSAGPLAKRIFYQLGFLTK